MDTQLTKKRATERKYLLKVIRCLRYFGRQGIALQGSAGNDNLTQLLRLLGANDETVLEHLDGKTGYKYTHSDVQNEILNIMATLTLQEKLKVIQDRKFFSIIADEGTDVSNKEQLSFCLRTVDDDLNSFEDFIGFHHLENIKSDTIVRVIKDILLRLNLNLENCRGQTYDGASNMMGKKSGVSTQILADQPKAVAVHCQGHSLSLSVKTLTNECDILRDTLSVVREICILVKFSPKRENLLGSINESIERGEEEFEPIKKLTKLSMTRWTVRAECMKRIIDNYQSLLKLWEECLEERLDQETRARILGCKNQMESFKFFFGLNLSHKLYAMTDNLSKALQGTKMSAIKGKKSADLVVATLKDIRQEKHFESFFGTVKRAAESTKEIGQPDLPRKRKRPNYSILQYVTGYEGPASNAYHPETAAEYFKQMYFEALDAIVNAIKDRFEQPALKRFMNVEELILKTINHKDTSAELEIFKTNFNGDFDADQLESELHLIPTLFKESNPVDFRDICKTLQSVDKSVRPLFKNIWTIIRIVLTSGATSATPERSFSMQRRIKTWLRSTMGQKRYNSLSLINAHADIVDKLSLIEVAERFTSAQDKRKNEFGTFTESDL